MFSVVAGLSSRYVRSVTVYADGMVRSSGLMEHARGLGARDHVCWRFDNAAQRQTRAREFLADGLARRNRVFYLGSGEVDALVQDLRDIDGIDAALSSGAARVASLESIYPAGAVVDPVAQVETYAEETEDAIAAGYTGLRVVADATALVRTPAQLAAFLRYEYLVDRYMTAHPFSALCAYDGTELEEQTLAQLASLHPASNTLGPGFRLHAGSAAGGVTTLSGELDVHNHELLKTILGRIDPHPHAAVLELDGSDLAFIDHRSLLHLIEHAERHHATLVLRTDWPGAARVVAALDLPNVRIEPAA
jgi:anti-anti-sigma regulatory factor